MRKRYPVPVFGLSTSDGVKLAYWEAGEGKPLIFIPGWSGNGAQYINLVHLLSRHYHVYVLDPRNQGLSQRVEYGDRISRFTKMGSAKMEKIGSEYLFGKGTLTPFSAQSSEHDVVDRTMQKMMRAFEVGDANLAFEVLRKDGMVLGYSPARGSMVTQTAEEWAKGFTGLPADEAQRHRRYEILDVTGNAAVVKVLLDYPGWDGLDYLVLSKIDGQWMIVSKSWSGQVKPKAP